MKRAPTRDILWLFFITRLALVLITSIAFILFTAQKYSSTGVDTVALLTTWNHWDAANYIRIAQFGYRPPFDYAFFPLFPALIRIIAHVLGSWSYLLIGTIISNVALLGALFVLYQLATEIGGDEVARRSLLYLVIFPTAFFFFAAYNESLFVLFTAGAFLAMRRQKWWLAGALGLLASLTRSAGLLLVIPYLVEVWLSRASIPVSWQKLLLRVLPVVLIPLGTLLYSIYCWRQTGNPIVYASVQSHWDRHTSWPWVGIFNAIKDIFVTQPFGSFFEVHILLDLSATLGFILLAILGWRKLRLSYSVWALALLLFMLVSSGVRGDILESNQRLVIEIFPAFITLAMLGVKHPRVHQCCMLLFPALLATLSIIFIMNRWMV
jgi:Gpi18-like mannosyltransferase